MDRKKSILNVTTSLIFRFVLLFFVFLTRRFLIQYIGDAANGLNSLLTSIIGVLAVAELGVGTAISFCMYKPIVENDHHLVIGLYCLFKKLYWIIGGIIFVVGLALLPAIPYLAKDYQLDSNIYALYSLSLVATTITYFYSANTSLINAYKNNYITTLITSIASILLNTAQLLVLYFTQSFYWFLACNIFSSVLQLVVTNIITYKKYGFIVKQKAELDEETKVLVKSKIKAMFMHKIGTLLVNTADSIIISAFISVTVLGYYSNYTFISNALSETLALFFVPLTSVFGHFFVTADEDGKKKVLNFFHTFNFILGLVFFIGYYACINPVINICFGEGRLLDDSTVIVITVNAFVQFMRKTVLIFRDSTGCFYNDRYKPLIEGIVNVVLSIILVKTIGIAGVILSTIITNLLICHIIEPYILGKYGLNIPMKRYYILNYLYIVVFIGLLFIFKLIPIIECSSYWLQFVLNGFIAVGLCVVPIVLLFIFNVDFRKYFIRCLKRNQRKGS